MHPHKGSSPLTRTWHTAWMATPVSPPAILTTACHPAVASRVKIGSSCTQSNVCKSKWRTMMCGTFQGYKKNTGARARHTLKEQAKCGYHVATKTQNKAQTEANRGNNCSPLYSKALYRRLPALVLPSLSSDASPLKLGHSSNIKLAWGAASLAKRSN